MSTNPSKTLAILSATLLAACATGAEQNLYDTYIDTTGDTLWDSAGDVPWDSVPDTFTDTGYDPYVDTMSDTMADTGLDTGLDTGFDVTDTITDTGVEDIPVDDGPATCNTADLVNQTMCGTGMKCTFTAVDAFGNPDTFCDTAGPVGYNEVCGSGGASDNCAAGYICLGSSGGTSRCRRFCSLDTTCTTSPGGVNAACEVGITIGATEVVGVTTCSFSCDPLLQTGCEIGQACRANMPGDYTFWSDCNDAGTGAGCITSSFPCATRMPTNALVTLLAMDQPSSGICGLNPEA